METLSLTFLGNVLITTGWIGCIVFKWVENTIALLTDVSMRADTNPKARRNDRPKGGHCEGRGLCSCPYRNISQLVRRLLPD